MPDTPEVPNTNSEDWGDFIRSQLSEWNAAEEEHPETDSEPVEDDAQEADTEDADTPEDEGTGEEQGYEAEDSEDAEDEEKENASALDDDTEIDMGEGRQPVKLSELKKGYLRQSDYTKKTQALAEERKALEQEREALKPVREWLDYITANPYLFNQIQQAIQQWNQTGVLPIEEVMQDAEYARYINHLLAENTRLQKELDSLKADYETVKFNTDMDRLINELKAEYGDLVTEDYAEELRKQAKEQNLSADVLKRIAKGDLAERKLQQNAKSKKETEAQTIQKIREKRLPPQPTKSKGQKPAKQEPNIADLDYLDLAKMAWEEM